MIDDDLQHRFLQLGLRVPRVYLPRHGTDLEKWAVVACDQYTSEPEYWEALEKWIGDSPSTLNLILPECYLSEDPESKQGVRAKEIESRIQDIHKKMESYVRDGTIEPRRHALQLILRRFPGKAPRTGLLAAIDLERYDYGDGSTSLIRPTEGTVLERIPPRMNIRRGAGLELPHVLILINDSEGSVIGPLSAACSGRNPVYQTTLNNDGGELLGYELHDDHSLRSAAAGFEKLAARSSENDGMLFAVGDGNHSLAAAKDIWEEHKKAGVVNDADQPCRFALVEIVNIHDDGIEFEPIHRVVSGARADDFLAYLRTRHHCVCRTVHSVAETMETDAGSSAVDPRRISFGISDGRNHREITVDTSGFPLAVKVVQDALDAYAERRPGCAIDYIHGLRSIERLSAQPSSFGIVLPPVRKDSFFDILSSIGVFPRKSFSMGEAHEKRYYFEARSIRCHTS